MITPLPHNCILKRTDILNHLIKVLNYKSYLEIGLHTRFNFNRIHCDHKVGVDPNPKSKGLVMTSDEYFANHYDFFDLIFIDGLHIKEQVQLDINNSLSRLNPQGTIVLHDCDPMTENMQKVPRPKGDEGYFWTGDVWKAFVRTRKERPNLTTYVVDIDFGCGVIEYGNADISYVENHPELSWENFVHNKKEWLNLVDTKYFVERTSSRKN